MSTFVITKRHSVSVMIDERVREELAGSTRFGRLVLLDSTDSTNRVAAEMAAAGAPEGTVVAADVQTAGRGRLGRSWESDPGAGLLVSVLLRPTDLPLEGVHLAAAAAAVAAREACLELASVECGIKWPNDLLVGERKLAGVLGESNGGAVVVGLGLNVHSGPSGAAVLDEEAGRRVGRGDLLVAWLYRLDDLLGNWEEIRTRYAAGCVTVGRPVRVDLGDGRSLVGFAAAVDRLGRLEVSVAGGGNVPVAVGDVVHLRSGSPTD
jgi:BirA family biotin operon repressor/biotin-[acetyl-CoA-carboxylase] ligase